MINSAKKVSAVVSEHQSFDQVAQDVEKSADSWVEGTTMKLSESSDKLTAFIRANPRQCLLGALAAGYIIARIARRK